MIQYSLFTKFSEIKIFYILLFFCLSASTVLAQRKITGLILGDDNLPLPGASVVLKGTQRAAIAAVDGVFSINAKSGDILEISFVGYQSQQITLGNQTSLKINLEVAIIALDEVIVAGYTTQKVKEMTGSVAVVKTKDLTSLPAGQVEQMLQGRVAGLNVITSGQPGGSSNVRLHGIGNFGDVTPLYIIDGVQGDINNLNPNDIESLQVLKDAGAYSIYGVRGANGVIVITTRSGQTGKTNITYDYYMGTTQPLRKGLDLLNSQEMADLTWLSLKNANQVDGNGNPNSLFYGNGAKPILPDYFLAGLGLDGLAANSPRANPDLYNIDFTRGPIYQIIPTNKTGTDWFHELFKPAFTHNHTLTVSGANDKNKYLFSLGYLNQQGTLLNTYLKRYLARINTSFSVNDHIRIGENLQLSYRDNPRVATQQGPNLNEVFQILTTQPILPVYDIKGGWAHFNPFDFGDNPIANRVLAKGNKTNYWEIFGNAYAEADFLTHFTARTSFGGSLTNYYSYNYTFNTYNPLSNGLPNNALNESSGYRRSFTWTNTLSFSKIISKHHSIKAVLGTEAIDNYNREVGGRKVGFFTNDVNYRFLSNGSPLGQSNYSFAGASTLFSLISRVDYGYKDKYYLSGTLRRDGSSIFGPEKQYGWFPSVSAAWRLTEEPFMKEVHGLTDLKLRASWGKTGYYGNTDPFNQYTLYGGSIGDAYYDINGSNNPVQGFRTVRLGEPSTGWQEDIVGTIGVESVFWNGKLSITADVYNKKASGLLFPVTLPDVLGGATAPNINVGIVQNTGIDLLVNSKGKFSKDWRWDATLTLTTYHNNIVKLNNLPFYFPPYEQAAAFIRNEVGHPTSSFYGYKIIGIFKDADEVGKSPLQDAAAPGRFKYLDANGDNKINDADRVYLGNANPKLTAGINIGLTYKNFDFSTFCYGSFGNDVKNVIRMITDFFPTISSPITSGKSKAALYDSWTPQNTNTSVPIAENNFNFSNLGAVHSYGIEKGSYFRNKSMLLGCTLPKAWLQKNKIEKLRVYVQVTNLFTITKYTGLDPELSGFSGAFGIDFGNYPNNQQQYLFGLNIGF